MHSHVFAMEPTTSSEIVTAFNVRTSKLIEFLIGRSSSEELSTGLDRLKSRLSIVRAAEGSDYPIKMVAPHFDTYSDQVTARNDEFFMNVDLAEIRTKDKEDEVTVEFVVTLRNSYITFAPKHRTVLWDHVQALHDLALQFLLIE